MLLQVKDELFPGTSYDQVETDVPLPKTDLVPLKATDLTPEREPLNLELLLKNSPTRKKVINMSLQAAVLGFHHRGHIHYTQGGNRWYGISHNRKAWKGQYPFYADCSAYVTWCLWNGFDHFHKRDTVNGQRWHDGYTGTLLLHGKKVHSPLPGDLIIYGFRWPGEHTAIYTGGGLVVSHGNERGPSLIRWNQMGIPVLAIRRYI